MPHRALEEETAIDECGEFSRLFPLTGELYKGLRLSKLVWINGDAHYGILRFDRFF